MKKLHIMLGALAVGAAGLAVADSLYVDATGNVGVGTNTPTAQFHIKAPAATHAQMNFSTDTGTWELKQNKDTGRLTLFYPGGGAATASFKFDPQAQENLLRVGVVDNHTVDITGRLLINNTQVNVPDYVFNADYALKSIEEQSEFMYKNKHLPSLPKAADDLKAHNVDLLAQQMGVLEELEKAHIYIAQMNSTIKEMKAEIEALKSAR